MSKLIINEDKTKGQIKDVVFCYVKMQDGAFKYQSKTEKEYTVDCIVDKATAKAYKKAFPKNGYKEIETDDFEGIFKIAPIYPDQEEQFLIKLKANANLKGDSPSAGLSAGDLIPYEWNTRPKVFVPADGGVSDVTMSVLVGNGSKGTVGFNITQNDFGTFPQLTGILVEDLIEYEQKGTQSDFGSVVGGLNPGDGNPEQRADTGKEEDTDDSVGKDPEPDFDDDQIPF